MDGQPQINLPDGPAAGRNEITFIGTATTLIKAAGFTILTDPNFLHRGQRAYVGLGVSTRRLTDPAMSIAELPPLDFIVLSHHHGDHFDRVAARGLDHRLPVVTEPHAAAKLLSQGFAAPVALQTWQSQTFVRDGVSVRVTSVPAQHAPRPLGYLLPPVMGSILDFSRDGERLARLYVTGDTLLHDGIKAIAERYGGIDLCLIHLGGTRIGGMLLTMDARQGVETLRIVGPREAIPVHYDDYGLFKSPLADFKLAAAQAGLTPRMRYLSRGETYPLSLGTAATGRAEADRPAPPGLPGPAGGSQA